jgi:hypothetical protein
MRDVRRGLAAIAAAAVCFGLVACGSTGTPACSGTGEVCTPSGTADACALTYATSCDANGTLVCAVASSKPDGTACGSALVCKAGGCVSSTATASVGTAGGTVETPAGATVVVPSGAVDGATTIQVSATDQSPPSGIAAVSPVYEFLPAGTLFARPVKVTLPLPAGVTSGSVYWSRLDGSGFDALGGTVDLAARTITVETAHFSLAVIGPAVTTRTVVGVGQTTFISSSSRVSVPFSGVTATTSVLVKDAGGAFVTLPGSWGAGASAGTFTIPDVPVGEYILRLGAIYQVMSTSAPDLGILRGGKPYTERTQVVDSSVLDLSIAGLAPWQATDQIEFFSTQVDQWDFDTELRAAPPITEGSVTASIPLDLARSNGGGHYAIEASKGDTAYVAQLSSATSANGQRYRAMARLGQLPAFDAPATGTTPASVMLTDVSQSNQVSVDFRATRWAAALALDGNPTHATACTDLTITGCDHFIGVLCQAGRAEDGFYASNADLLLYQDPSSDGVDVQTGTMTYGAPLASPQDPNWGFLFAARWTMPVAISAPGSSTPALLGDVVSWTTTVATGQAGPVIPPVTPATAITVAGRPFFPGGQGIGLTPTVSWSPPRTGQARVYTLVVYEALVLSGSTATTLLPRATIGTPHTSFEFPPGILEAGKSYVFALAAQAATSPAAEAILDAAPRKNSIDIATARVVSGLFTP